MRGLILIGLLIVVAWGQNSSMNATRSGTYIRQVKVKLPEKKTKPGQGKWSSSKEVGGVRYRKPIGPRQAVVVEAGTKNSGTVRLAYERQVGRGRAEVGVLANRNGQRSVGVRLAFGSKGKKMKGEEKKRFCFENRDHSICREF